jgi:hypothetical protein
MFIPLFLSVVVGAGVIAAWATQDREGEPEVTVRVIEAFESSAIYQADPKTMVSVVKEVGRWKAGDNVQIRFKWPCERLSCEWVGGYHPAMHEANRNASQMDAGLCYVVTLDRVSASKANFNSEMYDPREVPCSP